MYSIFTLYLFFECFIRITLNVACHMQLQMYPFDRQKCELVIESCEYLSIPIGYYIYIYISSWFETVYIKLYTKDAFDIADSRSIMHDACHKCLVAVAEHLTGNTEGHKLQCSSRTQMFSLCDDGVCFITSRIL